MERGPGQVALGSKPQLATAKEFVSWAIRATEWAIRATEEVAGDGISVEVLDLRTLVPLDREAVLRSVAKTGRLLIADGECVVLHCIQRPVTV